MKSKTGEARDPANDEEEALFQKLKPNYGSVPERPPPEVPDKPKFEVPSKDDAKVAPDVEEGGEERSVAGRKTMKLPKGKETTQSDGAREDPAVEQEMNNILKRSPSMYTVFLLRLGGLEVFVNQGEKLLSSPSPTAHSARKPSLYSLINITSSRHRLSSSWTNTLWAGNFKISLLRIQTGIRFLIFLSAGSASEVEMKSPLCMRRAS